MDNNTYINKLREQIIDTLLGTYYILPIDIEGIRHIVQMDDKSLKKERVIHVLKAECDTDLQVSYYSLTNAINDRKQRNHITIGNNFCSDCLELLQGDEYLGNAQKQYPYHIPIHDENRLVPIHYLEIRNNG
jgi:hypothetical protein